MVKHYPGCTIKQFFSNWYILKYFLITNNIYTAINY